MAITFYGLALFLLCLAQAGSNRAGDGWRMMLPPGLLQATYPILSLMTIVGFWGWLITGAVIFGMAPTVGCLVASVVAAYAVSLAVHPRYGAMFVVFGAPLAGLCVVLTIGG